MLGSKVICSEVLPIEEKTREILKMVWQWARDAPVRNHDLIQVDRVKKEVANKIMISNRIK